MKKILSILVCMTISALLISCGANEKTPTNEPQKENTTEDAEEGKSKTKQEDDAYFQGTYKNMTFALEPEWEFAEQENGAATLTFEPQKRVISMVSVDVSEMEQSEELLLNLGLTYALDGFEDVQLRQDFDTTVDDKPAKGTTASLLLSGTWYSGNVLSVVADDYQYSIIYLVSADADADAPDYTNFIESIKFQ